MIPSSVRKYSEDSELCGSQRLGAVSVWEGAVSARVSFRKSAGFGPGVLWQQDLLTRKVSFPPCTSVLLSPMHHLKRRNLSVVRQAGPLLSAPGGPVLGSPGGAPCWVVLGGPCAGRSREGPVLGSQGWDPDIAEHKGKPA